MMTAEDIARAEGRAIGEMEAAERQSINEHRAYLDGWNDGIHSRSEPAALAFGFILGCIAATCIATSTETVMQWLDRWFS